MVSASCAALDYGELLQGRVTLTEALEGSCQGEPGWIIPRIVGYIPSDFSEISRVNPLITLVIAYLLYKWDDPPSSQSMSIWSRWIVLVKLPGTQRIDILLNNTVFGVKDLPHIEQRLHEWEPRQSIPATGYVQGLRMRRLNTIISVGTMETKGLYRPAKYLNVHTYIDT